MDVRARQREHEQALLRREREASKGHVRRVKRTRKWYGDTTLQAWSAGRLRGE
jgi:hypothetical protein